jgi:tight adherence protein C
MIWMIAAVMSCGVSVWAMGHVLGRAYNRFCLRRQMGGAQALNMLPASVQLRLQPVLHYIAARRDRPRIQKMFPFVLDMMCLMLEAGLDFASALARISEQLAHHPMGREIALLLNDIQLGRGRADALRRFRGRLRIPAITRFASLLIQADTLGAPIGQLLRDEARQVRFDRFQTAERIGQAAAQKLLFPLVFCIMPVVFLVIFGPLFVQISATGLDGLLGGGL